MDRTCNKFKSLKPEEFTFTAKISDLPKPNSEFVKKLKGSPGVVPFPFVLLIQPEPDGPWELLNTNIPNFKLRTHKPFQLIKGR